MKTVLALFLALGIVVAACGGDDAEDTSEGSTTTTVQSAATTAATTATTIVVTTTSGAVSTTTEPTTTTSTADTTTTTSATTTASSTTTSSSTSTTAQPTTTAPTTTTTTTPPTTTTTVVVIGKSIADLPLFDRSLLSDRQQTELDVPLIPVLIPADPDLYAILDPLAGDNWYFLSADLPGEGFLFMEGEALVDDELPAFEPQYSTAEGFQELLFHAEGVEYVIAIECIEDDDPRCEDATYVNGLFAALQRYA